MRLHDLIMLEEIYLRIPSVDSLTVTYSPGPMMVYALTLNVASVSGEKFISVWFVSDVLVHIKVSLMLEQTSYSIITPFISNGGPHDSIKFVNVVFIVRSNTAPGTLVTSSIYFKSILKAKLYYTYHPAVSSQ